MHRGSMGTSMGGEYRTPARRKRDAERRRREEAAFARKSGKVTVRLVCVCPSPACKMHAEV